MSPQAHSSETNEGQKVIGFSDAIMEARFMELGIVVGEYVIELGRAPFNGAHRIQTSKGVFGLRTEEWKSLQLGA